MQHFHHQRCYPNGVESNGEDSDDRKDTTLSRVFDLVHVYGVLLDLRLADLRLILKIGCRAQVM